MSVENRMVVDSQWTETDPPSYAPRVYKKCDCGKDIVVNEEYWEIHGVTYCQDCIKEHIEDYLFDFRKVAE